ncbi:MAG: SpoVR family protein [Acidobacteriota bacterium]
MNLPPELETTRCRIEGIAREYGLDFFETIFEILDYKGINHVASYGGYPTRYPHWRFGMEYDHLSKSYSYGLHKIYEMVINNDPAYAYLLEGNALVDQKLVMAHVYAHVDFFKHNFCFAKTNRKMMDEMANHATRIRRYVDRFGAEPVEEFLDTCLSIENLIDIHAPYIARHAAPRTPTADENIVSSVQRMAAKEYMNPYINPPEFLAEERRKLDDDAKQSENFPPEPVRDVLLFLIEHAPLAAWQRDVLSIVREEAYYFTPQAQTKIMNEGWATFWHAKIMTEKVLDDSEVIDFADHHSRTLGGASSRVNPYKLGYELYKDIEDRWNRGRFGPEYEACDDMVARAAWHRDLGQGREKIFEVRRLHNDVTFIDTFLDEDFCHRHKMFMYAYDPKTGHYHIKSRDFAAVKRAFLAQRTNLGQPLIRVVDANHGNRGELFMTHDHEGIDLKLDEARQTLENVHAVWTRPVHLETRVGEKGRILSFDGTDHADADTAAAVSRQQESA